jgi:hypothetical protein
MDQIGATSAAGLSIRHAITTLGGALAAKGFIEGSAVEPLVGSIMVLIGIAWSGFQKYQANRI